MKRVRAGEGNQLDKSTRPISSLGTEGRKEESRPWAKAFLSECLTGSGPDGCCRWAGRLRGFALLYSFSVLETESHIKQHSDRLAAPPSSFVLF